MALPPEDVLIDRLRCPVQVQAEIVGVEPPDEWPGAAVVKARVTQVFRGSVRAGDSLTLQMYAARPEDDVPPSDFYYGWEQLLPGRCLEVCLTAKLELPYNSCCELLEAPTGKPVLELAPVICPRCGKRQDVPRTGPRPRGPHRHLESLGVTLWIGAIIGICTWFISRYIDADWAPWLWIPSLALVPLGAAARALDSARLTRFNRERPCAHHG